jgi:phospholipid/cholesterol/gamma-HCH transport system ATP-binding protein
MTTPATDVVIRVQGLLTRLGGRVLHDHIDLEVRRGEVLGVVGGSGAGKSVLLRTIIGLNHADEGRIEVLGQDMPRLRGDALRRVQTRWGVLFQDGALVSGQTVAENIQVPLREHTDLPQRLMNEIAAVKLSLVGLPPDAARKYPSELSGGMRKRAGLARALALDPEILFLDEPTSGLDPISANQFDELVRDLQKSLNLTVFMVTHDLDTLRATTDRIAVLVDRTLHIGTIAELSHDMHPWIHEYFAGIRGRAALNQGLDRVEPGDPVTPLGQPEKAP